MSILNTLVGLPVSQAASDDQGLGLQFENGAKLAIFNKYSLMQLGRLLPPAAVVGKSLMSVMQQPDAMEFRFDEGVALVVDLSPDGYLSVEAMTLTGPGTRIVVWN